MALPNKFPNKNAGVPNSQICVFSLKKQTKPYLKHETGESQLHRGTISITKLLFSSENYYFENPKK